MCYNLHIKNDTFPNLVFFMCQKVWKNEILPELKPCCFPAIDFYVSFLFDGALTQVTDAIHIGKVMELCVVYEVRNIILKHKCKASPATKKDTFSAALRFPRSADKIIIEPLHIFCHLDDHNSV